MLAMAIVALSLVLYRGISQKLVLVKRATYAEDVRRDSELAARAVSVIGDCVEKSFSGSVVCSSAIIRDDECKDIFAGSALAGIYQIQVSCSSENGQENSLNITGHRNGKSVLLATGILLNDCSCGGAGGYGGY